MRLKSSYSKKWLIYVVSFFIFFASLLLIIQYRHEKSIRIDALNEELDSYVSLVEKYIQKYQIAITGSYAELDNLKDLIPSNTVRITLIGNDGNVWYDSQVEDESTMENHLYRPEVQESLGNEFGTSIRISATTNIEYYYYARSFSEYFIRVSVVFNIQTRQFIKPDVVFLLLVALILLFTSFSVILITDKFGKSVNTLREFTDMVLANKPIEDSLNFPDDELGSIGQEIIDIYQKLNQSKQELISEKEKLIRHLNLLEEGIAIFSKDMHAITYNQNFMQYVNHISDTRISSADEFFGIKDFARLFKFIRKNIRENKKDRSESPPAYEVNINKSGKYYTVRSIVFNDKSFEVSIRDITKPAKRKLLKHELTENIAHELKTPVSSIKGLLETIIDNPPNKKGTNDFIQRAYIQSNRLADLINDISLLTKIEEASALYEIESTSIDDIVTEIIQETKSRLKENRIKIKVSLGSKLILNGNPVLLYSVFRNLIENAISHAGTDITIRIDKYTEDSKFYYFSFSDNGPGVPEKDLPRLFERFYRVDRGRERKKGGTGLGLAIVKNAIEFHKGDISVKNRNKGGLEFLFTISKELD